MGKKLIRNSNINEIYTPGDDAIYVTEDYILAPSAKDFAREHNLNIIYGNEKCQSTKTCAGTNNGSNDLRHQIECILKEEFGMINAQVVDRVMEKLGL